MSNCTSSLQEEAEEQLLGPPFRPLHKKWILVLGKRLWTVQQDRWEESEDINRLNDFYLNQ